MTRVLTCVLYVAGVYLLMQGNVHLLLLVAFGASVGALVGATARRWRGALAGAVIGAALVPTYLVLWFVFDLPPTVDFDL